MAKREGKAKERRARLKAAGLCRDCGRPAVPGHVYCQKCLKQVNRGTRKVRDARKEKGICERCGENPVFKAGHCESCYRESLARNLNRRDRLREEGLCLLCEQPVEPRPNGFVPPYCREHEREVYGRRRKVYWERRVNRLCVWCGKPLAPGDEGFAYCAECRERRRENKTRRKLGLPPLRKKFRPGT